MGMVPQPVPILADLRKEQELSPKEFLIPGVLNFLAPGPAFKKVALYQQLKSLWL